MQVAKIVQVNNHLFDVFIGDGWENWSRWNRNDKGFITQVKGMEVPSYIKVFIIKSLTPEKR